MYYVIFGDIIHSQAVNEYAEKEENTNYIRALMDQINTKYQNSIMAPFDIVRGDAFEGVLLSQQDILNIIREIIRSCWENRKIPLRISAVAGELTKVSFDTDEADGPAFYEAMQEIKKLQAEKSNHWFQVSIVINTIAQPLIDGLLSLMAELTARWTDKQRKLVWAKTDLSSNIATSQKIQASASVVSRQLKAAGFKTYVKAWKCLEQYLEGLEDVPVSDCPGEISYTTYYSLGLRKSKLRQYLSAIGDFKKSIELATEKFGNHDYRLARLYNGLAQAHLEMLSSDETDDKGREEAKEGARKAIASSLKCQKNSPSMTMEYARTVNIEGNYCLEIEKYQKALVCFKKAKSIIQALHGSSHPMLSDFDNNMAIAYKYMKEYDKAIQLYQTSLEAAEKNKEEDPLGYADSLYNIGLCYKEMGKYNLAWKYITMASKIIFAVLKKDDDYVVEVKRELNDIQEKAYGLTDEKEGKADEY